MTQTVYVEVGASAINTFNIDVPSGADTTSGYYLSYNAITGSGGGFTGTGWYLSEPGNPFTSFSGITSEQDIVDYYNEHNDNLTGIFSTWLTRVDERAVSSFCNKLMNGTAYENGCITMVH